MKILSRQEYDNIPYESVEDQNDLNFSDLVGKTIIKIDKKEDNITFYCKDEIKYELYHHQDCCESVIIDDIVGDLDDLIGTEILKAEETSNNDRITEYEYESWTYTFYHIATIKGYVTIRWYGSSNGYYSESVSFAKYIKKL